MAEKIEGESVQLPQTCWCSFCGKSQHEVKKLIAGPTVFICDECVRLCADICGFGIVEKLTPASDRVDMSCFGSARTDEDES